jgi:hypothetical protein
MEVFTLESCADWSEHVECAVELCLCQLLTAQSCHYPPPLKLAPCLTSPDDGLQIV